MQKIAGLENAAAFFGTNRAANKATTEKEELLRHTGSKDRFLGVPIVGELNSRGPRSCNPTLECRPSGPRLVPHHGTLGLFSEAEMLKPPLLVIQRLRIRQSLIGYDPTFGQLYISPLLLLVAERSLER